MPYCTPIKTARIRVNNRGRVRRDLGLPYKAIRYRKAISIQRFLCTSSSRLVTRAMDKLEFYIDDEGQPSARGRDSRLATYLETDLQGSREITRSMLEALENDSFRGEINGNGHSVSIGKKTVLIESLFDDTTPARRLSRDDLASAIRRWMKFIS